MNTQPPILYLTLDKELTRLINRRNKFLGEEPLVYKPNFREQIAVTKPYKGTRAGSKPKYMYDLCMYMYDNYEVKLANGIEADDLMSIDQMLDLDNSVICSRDKDLRITKGWHYGWECGKQPQFDLQWVDDLGWLKYDDYKKKLSGVGLKFFYSQMITGDTVDNIPGLRGMGPKAAYDLLGEAESIDECKAIVMGKYKEKHPENAKEYFTEQANLLWMLRDYDEKRGWNLC
jgi:hypothetical protein